MNDIKQAFEVIARSRAEKFTNDVQLGKYNLPAIAKGKQKFKDGPKIGDIATTTSTSTRKAGLKGTVTDRYKDNGYCYYVLDNGLGTQRQQDLTYTVTPHRMKY